MSRKIENLLFFAILLYKWGLWGDDCLLRKLKWTALNGILGLKKHKFKIKIQHKFKIIL